MNTILITGGSKGLGKAMVSRYELAGYKVISLARTTSSKSQNTSHIAIDLSNLPLLQSKFSALLDSLLSDSPESITLINNAGTLGDINVLAEISGENIAQTIALNYTAPMVMSALFTKKLSDYTGIKKIRNISSGAANGAYHGWSVYCSTKAAMDSFTKVIAVEQSQEEYPVHALSIYPGVIDTEMQQQIRNSSEKEFSNVARFKEMKATNQLSTPESVAELIYQIDQDSSIPNGEITDVREYNS